MATFIATGPGYCTSDEKHIAKFETIGNRSRFVTHDEALAEWLRHDPDLGRIFVEVKDGSPVDAQAKVVLKQGMGTQGKPTYAPPVESTPLPEPEQPLPQPRRSMKKVIPQENKEA